METNGNGNPCNPAGFLLEACGLFSATGSLQRDSSLDAVPGEADEEACMARVCRGDHDAFARLVELHSRPARALALRMLRDADLADDIVQEVFLAVWVRPRAWQPTGSFRSWILTLVSRRVMDHFRKRQPQVLQEEAFPEETQVQIPVWSESVAAPPQLAMDRETGRLVALALDHLVVKHRLALLLFYHEGMAVREIAQSMDLSDKAAESLLGRARTALRAQLERLLDREGTDA